MLGINEPTTDLDLMNQDLAKSGLVYQDMMARVADDDARHIVGMKRGERGYIIPYFDMYDKVLDFYRVRLFNPQGRDKGVKYIQGKETANHVYFPRKFLEAYKKNPKVVIFTEGEKKAAACCKAGFPAIAFGGVECWRNRIIHIPKEATILGEKHETNGTKVKLGGTDSSDAATIDEMASALALGLHSLCEILLANNSVVMICFDTDQPSGCKLGPQRAAATLGLELLNKGFNSKMVRQLILPYPEDGDGVTDKMGLDDFLLEEGAERLEQLIERNLKKRSAFPVHPTIHTHIAKQLSKNRLDRKMIQNLARLMIADLDYHGMRLYSPDNLQMYYFNGRNSTLMKADLNKPNNAGMQETDFGKFLYQRYGISTSADQKLAQWLGAQFAGEEPIDTVYPHRYIARHNAESGDAVRIQINNSKYLKITSGRFEVLSNGTENVLFESEMESGVNEKDLIGEIRKQVTGDNHIDMWWKQVMDEVRLKNPGNTAIVTALLYYISPYLLRWRGTQLPVELVVGEAGTGKSTLSEIRLTIIQGDPKLRNTPKDYKDWHAAIANSGGLHITDNVHMTDKNLKQAISDDLCRLVTEPDPRISMRKYFTEADERSIRINNVFGFTAIQQPFPNSDLLQRAMLLELSKPIEFDADGKPMGTSFDGHWKQKQLDRFGGRVGWLAHHAIVLQRFFKLVEEKWNPNYQSKHRLVNLEQCMMLMGEVFGLETSWIPEFLTGAVVNQVIESDWVLNGLKEFAKFHAMKMKPGWQFGTNEIMRWCQGHEDYEECHMLTHSRSLGRYMQDNKAVIAQTAGIVQDGIKNNRILYRLTIKREDLEKLDKLP